MLRWIHIVLLLLFLPLALWGQTPSLPHASAELDTSRIRIGEQANLHLSITYRVDEGERSIEWPSIGDTLSSPIEIVRRTPVDTTLPQKEEDLYLFRQSKTLTLTSFDTGYHPIPPFSFTIGEQTLETKALLLEVRTVEVDTAQQSVKDIKEIFEIPFSFQAWLQDNWPWLAGGAGILAVALLLWYYLKKRKRQPSPEPAVAPPPVPPHEKALQTLDELLKQKLWQNGQVKAYHVQLSEIIRTYIEERFGINAPELTTGEILHRFRFLQLNNEAREALQFVLELTDLVKFAREEPAANENEEAASRTRQFIEQTKQETAPGETNAPEQEKGNDQ